MLRSWRWFGPNDPVTLNDASQAGAHGIVSSLHHLPDGALWSAEEVRAYNATIEAAGLTWSVVESLPVSTEIKVHGPQRATHIDNYRASLRAIAQAGIRTVCYNFIPLVDWVRTELRYPLRSGYALRFDMVDFVACDLFILNRSGAEGDYDAVTVAAARDRFAVMDESRRRDLEASVLAPLPGGTTTYNRREFETTLARFVEITEDQYFANLVEFLNDVLPTAEELGIALVIHPDDPPINLFGLPRLAGSAAQLRRLFSAAPSPANGLTFCVGSLGVREENDLPAMVREFASRIGFAHLRNVKRQGGLSFYEAEHLYGSSDIAQVVRELLHEERRRVASGRADWQIPMRPDHGHLMLEDAGKTNVKPGYSAIGRMKGMAELNGLIAAFELVDGAVGGAR